ncbi:hypothetical protein [Conexibacter arvalis]|uniref:Uncharacterized protein n=1 Tax=Conexibacter arvalis TaxID=912552 RepID=A0A840IJ50_9ACTN|nr:hypothetical protein [Conexibacter arvalis]MBB4664786.1 hypothetical protein [Conexibacter arvalis]
MADVHALFDAFVAADRGPAPADPHRFLDQVAGLDRRELELLIDGYLQRAPRRTVSPEVLRAAHPAGVAAGAARTSDRVERAFAGASGSWPVLLPRLREAARLPRRALVDALSSRLGVEDETERVAAYYHEMERGLLPADGVSDRVLVALAALLGESAERLRAAGRAIAPPAAVPGRDGTLAAAAFARTATPDEELAPPAEPAVKRPQSGRQAGALVDALFTGGPDAGATA